MVINGNEIENLGFRLSEFEWWKPVDMVYTPPVDGYPEHYAVRKPKSVPEKKKYNYPQFLTKGTQPYDAYCQFIERDFTDEDAVSEFIKEFGPLTENRHLGEQRFSYVVAAVTQFIEEKDKLKKFVEFFTKVDGYSSEYAIQLMKEQPPEVKSQLIDVLNFELVGGFRNGGWCVPKDLLSYFKAVACFERGKDIPDSWTCQYGDCHKLVGVFANRKPENIYCDKHKDALNNERNKQKREDEKFFKNYLETSFGENWKTVKDHHEEHFKERYGKDWFNQMINSIKALVEEENNLDKKFIKGISYSYGKPRVQNGAASQYFKDKGFIE